MTHHHSSWDGDEPFSNCKNNDEEEQNGEGKNDEEQSGEWGVRSEWGEDEEWSEKRKYYMQIPRGGGWILVWRQGTPRAELLLWWAAYSKLPRGGGWILGWRQGTPGAELLLWWAADPSSFPLPFLHEFRCSSQFALCLVHGVPATLQFFSGKLPTQFSEIWDNFKLIMRYF